jgi:hypothetical protein
LQLQHLLRLAHWPQPELKRHLIRLLQNAAANSKLQLSMDVSVVAPGNTTIEAQLTDSKGNDVGEPAMLSLNLTVIDSRVAWFTTGAAIILFLAAVAQSVRRIRRSKK